MNSENPLKEYESKISSKGFLEEEILKMAEKLGEEMKRISTSKMRQYFDEIKGLRRMIESGSASSEQIIVKLHLIRSRIYYDSKRDGTLQPLKEFLNKSIDKIFNEENILGATQSFSYFFENLYGYFYFYSERTEGGV